MCFVGVKFKTLCIIIKPAMLRYLNPCNLFFVREIKYCKACNTKSFIRMFFQFNIFISSHIRKTEILQVVLNLSEIITMIAIKIK